MLIVKKINYSGGSERTISVHNLDTNALTSIALLLAITT